MKHQLILAVCLTLPLAASPALATGPSSSFPPLSYFHLPATLVGVPEFQSSGEGSPPCQPAPCPADIGGSGFYHYGVKANAPVNSTDGPYSMYEVHIYHSISEAENANFGAQETAGKDDAGAIIPYLPIKARLAPNQWLRGKPVIGSPKSCVATGGLRDAQVVMTAHILDHGSLSKPACANEEHWVLRALAALYVRAKAYLAQSGSLPPNSLQAFDWDNASYPFPCDPTQHATIRIRNGSGKMAGFAFEISSPTFGDLTGDKQPEAIIPYDCIGADSVGTRVFVYTETANHPILLAQLPSSQGPADTQSIVVNHETLQLSGRGYTPTAAHCCPDLHITTSYHWNGKAFAVVKNVVTHVQPPS